MFKVKIVDLDDNEVLIDSTVEAVVGGIITGREDITAFTTKSEAECFVLGRVSPREVAEISDNIKQRGMEAFASKLPDKVKKALDELSEAMADDFVERVLSGKIKPVPDKKKESPLRDYLKRHFEL